MDLIQYESALNNFIGSEEFASLDDASQQERIKGIRDAYLDQNRDTSIEDVDSITENSNKRFLRGTGRGRAIPTLDNIIFPNQEAGFNDLTLTEKNAKLEEFRNKIPELAKQNPTQREDTEYFLKQSIGELDRRVNGEGKGRIRSMASSLGEGFLATLAESVGATDTADGIRSYFTENPEYDGEFFTNQLSQGVGSGFASVAIIAGLAFTTKGLGGTAAAAEAIGTTGSLLTNGIMRYNEGYKNAIDAGLDEDKASEAGWAATPAATIDALSDRILASGIMPAHVNKVFSSGSVVEKRAMMASLMGEQSAKGRLFDYAKTALGEGLSESAGDYAAAYGPYLVTDNDKYLPTAKESLNSFLLGAVIGGGMTAGFDLPNTVGGKQGQTRIVDGKKVTESYATKTQRNLAETQINLDELKDKDGTNQIFTLLSQGNYKGAYQLSTEILKKQSDVQKAEEELRAAKQEEQKEPAVTGLKSNNTVENGRYESPPDSGKYTNPAPETGKFTIQPDETGRYQNPPDTGKYADKPAKAPNQENNIIEPTKVQSFKTSSGSIYQVGEKGVVTTTVQDGDNKNNINFPKESKTFYASKDDVPRISGAIQNQDAPTKIEDLNNGTISIAPKETQDGKQAANAVSVNVEDSPKIDLTPITVWNDESGNQQVHIGDPIVETFNSPSAKTENKTDAVEPTAVEKADINTNAAPVSKYSNVKSSGKYGPRPVSERVAEAEAKLQRANDDLRRIISGAPEEWQEQLRANQAVAQAAEMRENTVMDQGAFFAVQADRFKGKFKKAFDRMVQDVQAKTPDLQFMYVPELTELGAEALYDPNKNIIMFRDAKPSLRALAHETTHALTVGDINAFINNRSEATYSGKLLAAAMDEATPEYLRNLIKVYNHATIELGMQGVSGQIITDQNLADSKNFTDAEYAFTNIEEFVAEAVSNRQFQDLISQIPYEGKSIWNHIVDIFKNAWSWISDVGGAEFVMRNNGDNVLAATLGLVNYGMYQENNINETFEPAPIEDVKNTIEESLTTVEKQEAAQELGFDSWSEEASVAFAERFADWAANAGKELSAKLAELFSKIAKSIKVSALAIGSIVTFGGNSNISSQSVQITPVNISEFVPGITIEVNEVGPSASTTTTQDNADDVATNQSANKIAITEDSSISDLKISVDGVPVKMQEASPVGGVNTNGHDIPSTVESLANFHMDNKSNGKSFVILDKESGKMTFFDKSGNVIDSVSWLWGRNDADFYPTGKADNWFVTPAGEFTGELFNSQNYGLTIWFDTIDNGDGSINRMLIHRRPSNAVGANPTKQRDRALASKTPKDNAATGGCANLGVKDAKRLIPRWDKGGKVYVLPRTQDGWDMFTAATGFERPKVKNNINFLPSITQEEDASYLKAVKQGDMETAQRMVDEAAKKAGYTIGPVYHGTPDGGFYIFDDSLHQRGGFFFTEDEYYANQYAKGITNHKKTGDPKTYKVYLKIDNPAILRFDASQRDQIQRFKNQGYDGFYLQDSMAGKSIMEVDNELWREIQNSDEALKLARNYGGFPNSVVDYAKKTTHYEFTGVRQVEAAPLWAKLYKDKGYDAKVVENEPIKPSGIELGVFKGEQIKSADPVTYTEDGDPIPLSKRFNERKNNINFLPSKTARQKATEEGFRPETFYHGTRYGGHTFFDTSLSGYHYGPGSSFTTIKAKAEGYQGVKNDYRGRVEGPEGSELYEVYLKYSNPYKVESDAEVSDLGMKLYKSDKDSYDRLARDAAKLILKDESRWQEMGPQEVGNMWLREQGYDSIEKRWRNDPDEVQEVVIFDANNIKRTGDTGVPVEQRFDTSKNNINFLPSEVSESNILRFVKVGIATQNGNVTQIGKISIAKDGLINENRLLSASQMNRQVFDLIKEVYPEAWTGENVDINKLIQLEKDRPLFETHVYGQDGKIGSSSRPAKDKFDRIVGELDRLGIHNNGLSFEPDGNRFTVNGQNIWIDSKTGELINPQQVALTEQQSQLLKDFFPSWQEYSIESDEAMDGPRATSYYNTISPFDTTKYPVVRIDVTVPVKGVVPDVPRDGSYTSSADLRRIAETREKSGVLWGQDDLHENLPNTLGWAMVQFVPHPQTGETVMFVAEQQSRWGQEANKKKARAREELKNEPNNQRLQDDLKSPHPLLDVQHKLVLKAAMDEARKRGVTKMVVSDGETAMMTERHDAGSPGYERTPANTIPALRGKAIYDEKQGRHTYKLSGDYEWRNGNNEPPALVAHPQRGEAGIFDMGKKVYLQLDNLPADIRALVESDIGVPKYPQPSQAGGMRQHYDQLLQSAAEKMTGSKGEVVDMGVHKNAQIKEDARGNQFSEAELEANGLDPEIYNHTPGRTIVKGSPVFRNPDGTPKATATGMMYDISPSVINNINYLPGQTPAKRDKTFYRQLASIVSGNINDKADVATHKIISILADMNPSDIMKIDDEAKDYLSVIVSNIYNARKSAVMNPQMRVDSDLVISHLEAIKTIVDQNAVRKIYDDYDGIVDFGDLDPNFADDKEELKRYANEYMERRGLVDLMENASKKQKSAERYAKIQAKWRAEFDRIREAVIERFADAENYISETESLLGANFEDPYLRDFIKIHFGYLTNLDVSQMQGRELYQHFFAINNMIDGSFRFKPTVEFLAKQRNKEEVISSLKDTFRDPVINSSKFMQWVDEVNQFAELHQVQLQRLSALEGTRDFLQNKLLIGLHDAIMTTSYNRKIQYTREFVEAKNNIMEGLDRDLDKEGNVELNTEDRVITSIMGRLVQFAVGENPDVALVRNIKKERKSIQNIIHNSTSVENVKLHKARVQFIFDEMVTGLEAYGPGAMAHLIETSAARMAGTEGVAAGDARLQLLSKAQEIFSRFNAESKAVSEGFFNKPFKKYVNYMSNEVMSTDAASKSEWKINESVYGLDEADHKISIRSEAAHLKERQAGLGDHDSYSYNLEGTFYRNVEKICVDNGTISERQIIAERLRPGSELNNIISLSGGVDVPHQGRVAAINGMIVRIMSNATSKGQPLDFGTQMLRGLTGMYAKATLSSVHHIVTQPIAAAIDYSLRTGNISGWLRAALYVASNHDKVNAWLEKNQMWTRERSITESMGLDQRRSPKDDSEGSIKNNPAVKYLSKYYDKAAQVMTFFIHQGDNFAVKATLLAEYERLLTRKYGKEFTSLDDIDFNTEERRILTEATLNAEKNINTSNKILRGELFTDRRITTTLVRNLLFAFSAHQASLATQLNQAVRDLKELKSMNAPAKEMEAKIRTISAITMQQAGFTTARFAVAGLTARLMIGLVSDLFDDEEGKISDLETALRVAQKKGNPIKIAQAENELANAQSVRKVITQMKYQTQSADSLFKQVMRDSIGSFHISFNMGAMQQALAFIPDAFQGRVAKEGQEREVQELRKQITIAKDAKNEKLVGRLTEQLTVLEAMDYIPYAYPNAGGVGLSGIYGATLDTYKRATTEISQAVMGVNEWNYTDFVIDAATLGVGQSEFTKTMNFIDKIEDEHWKQNKTYQEQKLPAAKKKEATQKRRLPSTNIPGLKLPNI